MNMADRFRTCAVILGVSLAMVGQAACAEAFTRAIDGVTRIHFRLPGELQVRYGATEQLVVEAEPSVMPKLDIAVRGDTLVLASKGSFKTDKQLRLTVTIKSLRSLKSEGSGKVLIANFTGSDIDIDAAGSGSIVLKNVKPGRLAIVVKGSGGIEASGSGKYLQARIDGSGSIDAVDFQAKAAEASITGSGDIRVHAEESLKGAISGAGNIGYRGNAKVTQSITGAGSIDRL